MIYTSYFAKKKEIEDTYGLKCISISLWTPKGITIDKYPQLAPTKDILTKYKANPDKAKYYHRYINEVLSKLDVNKVYKDLDGYVLLCYEKTEDFCHRHIVSEWFRNNGYKSGEIKW